MAQFTLDFNKPLLDLDGNAVLNGQEQQMLGKVLAMALISTNKGNAVKMLDWAMNIHKGKSITLDKSDKNTLEEFVKDNEMLTVLSKGQILEVIHDTKED